LPFALLPFTFVAVKPLRQQTLGYLILALLILAGLIARYARDIPWGAR